MILCDRIKELRKEKGWKQGDLADHIGSDARQISRYENGKVTPSPDAIVKIAMAFDVTIDYLLIEDAPRRPLKTVDPELMNRLQSIQSLSEQDKTSLFHILDALLTKNKVKALANDFN
jgi:transcriptional regulator with XRE-family HTH domain